MSSVVITTGDPAGCGPFITLKAIEILRKEKVDFYVVGDEKVLGSIPTYKKIKKRITLVDLNTPAIEKIKKGYFSKLSGEASLNYLKKGLEIMKNTGIKRIITAPLSKEAVKFTYSKFSGHTEFLANYFKVRNIEMMMVSGKLKVILFTRHIPLREVPSFIRKKDLIDTFFLVYSSLKKMFKIKNPLLAVTSLNPHAGLDTFLGREEKIVYDAIRSFGHRIYGPFPSDTIFIEKNLRKYHCIICLYHDQAMVPFKLLSFREGVNLTLGLPVIRTSPAHGVAYDAMRNGATPFSSSMLEAIRLALKLSL